MEETGRYQGMALTVTDTDRAYPIGDLFTRRRRLYEKANPKGVIAARYWWALPVNADVEVIQQIVADHYQMPYNKMKGVKKDEDGHRYTVPRYVAMYLVDRFTLVPRNKIALYFGLDRSMIYTAIRFIRSRMQDGLELKNINELEHIINSKFNTHDGDKCNSAKP